MKVAGRPISWWLRFREKPLYKGQKRDRIYHLREVIYDSKVFETEHLMLFCPADFYLWSRNWLKDRPFSDLWTGGISEPGIDIKDREPNDYGWCGYCWTDEKGRPHFGHTDDCTCGACEHRREEAAEAEKAAREYARGVLYGGVNSVT